MALHPLHLYCPKIRTRLRLEHRDEMAQLVFHISRYGHSLRDLVMQ
jgi:hypothetical protein